MSGPSARSLKPTLKNFDEIRAKIVAFRFAIRRPGGNPWLMGSRISANTKGFGRRPAGFTLVEIMVVVVIIGLLAALAIPAFRKTRNTAVEKTLFNDARQISSACAQYFTENSTTRVTLETLIGVSKNLNGLSSGTLVNRGISTGNLTSANLWTSMSLASIEFSTSTDATPADAIFALGNQGYDASLSAKADVRDPAMGDYASTQANYLNFSVETGQLLKRTASGPEDYAR